MVQINYQNLVEYTFTEQALVNVSKLTLNL